MVAQGNKYFNNGLPDGFMQGKELTIMADKPKSMTTSGGNPIAGNQNSITAGALKSK